MKDIIDFYLTSPDWIYFSYSKQLTKIESVRIGLIKYLLVKTKDTIKVDNVEMDNFLLLEWPYYVYKNFRKETPKYYDVYVVRTTEKGKLDIGKLIARDVALHKHNE